MEFETRIVNGKPSIYFKNDLQKNVTKKVNTKDAKNKKEIKKSMGISGEVDKVKPSPRHNELQNENQLKLIYNVLNQNGVKMSPNQLAAFLEQIQSNEKGSNNNLFRPTEQNNKNNMNYYSDQEQEISSYSSKPRSMLKKKDLMIENIEPQSSNSNQDEYQDQKFLPDNEKTTGFGNRLSLTEKKKIKWQQDKELFEKLNQQENNDALKSVSPRRFYQTNVPNVAQKENFNEAAMPSKLSLTEKKKIQWQKEREESEKRELEQRLISHDSKRYPFDFSPERRTSNENYAQRDSKFIGSTKNLEYDHANNQDSVINLFKKSNSLNSLDNGQKNAFSAEFNQIQQENKFDRAKMNSHLDKEQKKRYWPYENNHKNKNSTNHSDQIEEFKKIKQQIDEITAFEKSLQNEENAISNNTPKYDETKTKHDQSRVPPAMRTSISFGGVVYDDEIKKTKELERKKWLHDLEEQKKEKLIESQQPLKKYHQDSHAAFNSEQKNLEEKSFGRTRNLLDPAQIDEMERRKKQGLQHKLEIEAQIAEKKRIKMIEEEIQNLNNMKVENEALEMKQASKVNEEKKKQNSHYQNFEKILNSSRPSNLDVSPSVLQGEYNKYDQESKTMRSNITETRSQEIYRKMQQAELAAAEEKHKKLLKRLQKGGHDTSQLEKKFAELKAKLTRNPEHLIRDTSPHMASHYFNESKPIESNRINNNSSHMSHMNEMNMDTAFKKASQHQYKSSEGNEKKSEGESIEQIFRLLRIDSAGLPAEIKEEDLRLLLKNAVKAKEISTEREKKTNKNSPNSKTKESNDCEDEKLKVGVGKDGKPIWNFKNLKGKKAVSNSQKDPFYYKRAQQAEERKMKRMEYYKNFNQREKNRPKEQNESVRSYRSDRTNEPNLNLALDNEDDINVPLMSKSGENKAQTESIMNLLSKNLAKTPIYEEDEDLYLNENYPGKISHLNIKDPSFFNSEENSGRGFVPFMRTNEILDPIHAGSPVPPSRESSAVKRDRERARQAYIQNMRPSDYGFSYDGISYRNQLKDPLLNNGLVKNNPTPRQEQILNQLASLKQSLINKQKEIASSIYNDSDENLN